jgi:hypothetical protein
VRAPAAASSSPAWARRRGGRKVAGTLSSTGTPALFFIPAKALHGDLGTVTEHDVVSRCRILGETDELLALRPAVKRRGARLSRSPEYPLDPRPHGRSRPGRRRRTRSLSLELAPTTSTTAMMALGDALAVALMEARGFGARTMPPAPGRLARPPSAAARFRRDAQGGGRGDRAGNGFRPRGPVRDHAGRRGRGVPIVERSAVCAASSEATFARCAGGGAGFFRPVARR